MDLIYEACIKRKLQSKRSLAVLIDPDDLDFQYIDRLVLMAEQSGVDFFLVGGSLIMSDHFGRSIQLLKSLTDIPVIIFPGNNDQIHEEADAILLLSLISGRNPELLIGKHVQAAPALKRSGLEILPTGYMLIDGGLPTSVSYISNTLPIPGDKPDIAACTAMAGEMLGLKNIYMDAGSGAKGAIREEMIQAVSENISVPLWIGGGIKCPEQIYNAYVHGADIVVVGNAIESDPLLMKELASVPKHFTAKIRTT